MSTEYVERTETTTTSDGSGISFQRGYLQSLKSYLKIAEMVLDLIAFICASVDWWVPLGQGWAQFVFISALITTLIFFIFHLFNVISKLPGPWIFIEFVYYVVYCVLIFIAAIVCLARGAQFSHGGIIAATIFGLAAFAVYCVDTFFMYRNWQASKFHAGSASGDTTGATTTTTTHTTYETRTQY
ncbi:CKLF-like MARVEL transmembrane domain-containing protein 4 [Ostrea edulis]|uniref:CKLF-like MARVEL transmembrane domain-containing protein 4 n=1 Tax=Ostrea edulis TaxID=37623 RepID=UPI002095A8B9|nr:CKLF-like MARVEL transmembrane domain-containing protein 4 [Ostrea edulis]XP_056011664.1 CKLF-like MARVEL transmembrane domain-containing protein 4 [Ostrea edulis]XP_056011667.1 CKLF-like MARVEL transmembrane domain-containing protein 4 [Ostrea edulis]